MRELEFLVSKPFDFESTVCSYGWIDLAPCRWISEQRVFQRVERLNCGQVVLLNVSAANIGRRVCLTARIQTSHRLTSNDIEELRAKVAWTLRLNENFSGFYRLARNNPHLYARVRGGAGRLLRSPSLFEDVVKTICTTNTTWSQTVGMVQRLVDRIGDPFPLRPEWHAFPTPEQIVRAGLHALQADVRLGYRSQYIFQLAHDVASGECDIEALKSMGGSTEDLRRAFKKIKGVGDYAANTLLMLLGRYEELAIDSEMREFVSHRYFRGRPVSDTQIRSMYEQWDKWKYLAYWFELVGD